MVARGRHQSGRAVIFAGITVMISLLGLFIIGLVVRARPGRRQRRQRAGHDGRRGHAAAGAARLRRHARSTTRRGPRPSPSRVRRCWPWSACSPASASASRCSALRRRRDRHRRQLPAVRPQPAHSRCRTATRKPREQQLLVPLEPPHPAPPVAAAASSGVGHPGRCWRMPLFSHAPRLRRRRQRSPKDTDHAQAYDLLAEGFGPGSNGPLFLASTDPTIDAQTARRRSTPRSRPTRTSRSSRPASSVADGTLVRGRRIPTSSPQDEATTELVTACATTCCPRHRAST